MIVKRSKRNVQKLIKNKKRDFCKEKFRENVCKPKKLKKALKSLGLSSKITPVSQVSLKDGEKISFVEKTNNSFNNFYANLAPTLGEKFPPSPNKFYLDSV